ncbi:acyloxyacyl hydrolase [Desulfamplus magnetovallimortis]|nr:acyloxyacyl hydrolase [Desulfamplus magnetovallimortis]
MIVSVTYGYSDENRNIPDAVSEASPRILISDSQTAIGFQYGMAYDPDRADDFVSVNGFMLFDYERIWGHAAPDNLKFKIDFTIGTNVDDNMDSSGLILSSGFEALLYLKKFEKHTFLSNNFFYYIGDFFLKYNVFPYVEAGVGIIYTEHQIEGQGLHFNFNPRAGIGAEYRIPGKRPFFAELKLWHLSNANLHKDNRGINALLFMVGKYF